MTTGNAKVLAPKHVRLYEHLRPRILSGEWRHGERMLSDRDIRREFGASRQTIEKAMRRLEAEGLVVRSDRSGTYVQDPALRPGDIAVVVAERCFLPGTSPFFRAGTIEAVRIISEVAPYWRGQIQVVDDRAGIESIPARLHLFEPDILRRLRGVLGFLPLPGAARQLDEMRIPYVYMCHHRNFEWRYQVFFDFTMIHTTALVYLRGRGVKSVGAIWQGTAESYEHSLGHWTWFSQAARAAGMPVERKWTLAQEGPTFEQVGYDLFRRFWNMPDHPEALFVDDEVTCRGVIRAALEMGVRFPEDLLLVATNASGAPISYHRPVTCVEMDPIEYARAGVKLLHDVVSGKNIPQQRTFLPGKLVIGETA